MRSPAALALAVMLGGCGGSATAPDAVATSITLIVPAALGIGESVVATASAGTRQIGSGWRSEDPSIATVTDGGVITGVGNGHTRIIVIHAGQQATAAVRVVPEYRGQWTATYRITLCTPGPSEFYRQTFCGDVDRTTGNVTFTFVRTGAIVTGQFQLFGAAFPAFTVPIAEDGSIQFTSTAIAVPTAPKKTDAQFTLSSGRRGQIEGRAYWVLSGSAGLVGWGIAEGSVTGTQ